MQNVEVLDHAADVRRVELQRLLQFAQHADEIDDQPDPLLHALPVDIGPVHARDGLQQHVVAHRLVEIHAVEDRRVVAGEQLVGDDEDLRVLARPF